LEIGKNKPHKNNIGKRKKFEKVCASKTSLTETAIKSPRKVELIDIRIIVSVKVNQSILERENIREAIIIGMKAFIIPKSIAPAVLASISSSRDIGARSRRSNERLFFSNVIVTESKLVVPKSIEIPITPGSNSGKLPRPCPDLIKNIPVQASGKIIPQLILGGFK